MANLKTLHTAIYFNLKILQINFIMQLLRNTPKMNYPTVSVARLRTFRHSIGGQLLIVLKASMMVTIQI